MLRATAVIQSKVGLHARPASMVVKAAKKYKSKIEIVKGDSRSLATSLISIMALGVGYKDTVEIAIEGTDEKKAMAEMAALISSDFSE